MWRRESDKYDKRKSEYDENKSALYMLVWGQCSEGVKSKIKSVKNYTKMQSNYDCLGLLLTIKGITFKFETQVNIFVSIREAKIRFYGLSQRRDESNTSYLNMLKNMKIASDTDTSVIQPDVLARAQVAAREKHHAVNLILGSDMNRYSVLAAELSNRHSLGQDMYPSNVTDAYILS